MPVSFAGRQCIDPMALYRSCQDHDPPIPVDAWFGKANSFRCPVQGRGGRGMILLRKADLDAIRARGYGTDSYGFPVWSDLIFRDDAGNVATFKNLFLLGGECVTPGYESDPDAAYLCEVLDQRARILSTAGYNFGNRFNLRLDRGSLAEVDRPGFPANSNVTWTYGAQLLWVSVFGSAQAYPGLPFTPQGTPGSFLYSMVPIAEALDHYLLRIGCVLVWRPDTNAYSIARIGATDTAAAAALTQLRSQLIDTDYSVGGTPGVPYRFQIYFREYPRGYFSETYQYVTNTNYNIFEVTLHDDLCALRNNSSSAPFHTNSAAMTSRANERASDYLRIAALSPERRTYRGCPPSLARVLGAQWSEYAVMDRGGGVTTEIAKRNFAQDLIDWRWTDRPLPLAGIPEVQAVYSPTTSPTVGVDTRLSEIMEAPFSDGGGNATGDAAFHVSWRVRAYFHVTLNAAGGAAATLTMALKTVDAAGAAIATVFTTNVAAGAGATKDLIESIEAFLPAGNTSSPVRVAIFILTSGAGATCTIKAAPANCIHGELVYYTGVNATATTTTTGTTTTTSTSTTITTSATGPPPPPPPPTTTTTTTSTTTTTTTTPAPSCCSGEIEHSDLIVVVPDGTYAGSYTFSWTPFGGNWIGFIDTGYTLYCAGGTWQFNGQAATGTCSPFSVTFPPMFGSTGNITISL